MWRGERRLEEKASMPESIYDLPVAGPGRPTLADQPG